ncbi:lipoprotein [Catenulispora acidiphila DSM 44928]|uniref:Lipoprotein n=1 Tax=Catenulispora acidiphila (strain DSM 44928 / JCM 14897 / NBRC 102108 / NRRL B-24433 / ID139908) TaxID=479433 RepID=C7QJ03_CATAD|nr:hypothetical protein [Catenulispora acidiphila]ACU69145.1 lipoprotein [Catenulispora acidiphila DSM 44928]
MIQARSVRLAAVIVLGGAVALATSACGGPMQAGAAAVVQGQRTTDATVQDQVASIVSLVQHNNLQQGDVTDEERSALAKAQINLLVQQAVWQKVADDNGVKVTAADDAKEHSALVEQARGSLQGTKFTGSDNEAVALADAESQQNSSGLAPSSVPVYSHIQALVTAVIDDQATKLRVDPNDQNSLPALQGAILPMLSKASTQIDVKISPRYGSFDASTRQVVAAQTSWIRPTKAQVAAAAAAQAQQQQSQ